MMDIFDLHKLREFLKSKNIEIIGNPYVYIDEINNQDLENGMEDHPDHYVVTFDGKFLILKKEINEIK